MFEQPFKKIRFHMIATPTGALESHDVERERDVDWVDLPLDPAIGTAQMLRLNLALGMSLSTAKIRFTDAALGRMIHLLEIETAFREPSFQVVVVRGVRSTFTEKPSGSTFTVSQGLDLFRYAQKYQTNISLDGSFSGEFYLLSVSRSVMNNLIGPSIAESLLSALALPELTTRIIAVPQFVSNHLVSAFSSAMISDSRKLFAQARSLELLAALVEHFVSQTAAEVVHDSKAKQRARDLHDELQRIEGKLPTLDELAERHGRSAKLLNEEFEQEYGESIYSFVTNYRLQQAHEALQSTEVSIKMLSVALGYSHVSNFTTAFKRKFGYPPGSLRNKSDGRNKPND